MPLTSEDYKTYLASSKPYMWLPWWAPRFVPHGVLSAMASLRNIQFGIGHGHSANELFIPSMHPKNSEAWRTVLYHTLVDRLGALALLPARLDKTYVLIRFSDHAHDLAFLKKHFLTQ